MVVTPCFGGKYSRFVLVWFFLSAVFLYLHFCVSLGCYIGDKNALFITEGSDPHCIGNSSRTETEAASLRFFCLYETRKISSAR